MRLTNYLLLLEEAGPKVQLLKKMIKHLNLPIKLKMLEFESDDTVDAMVKVMNLPGRQGAIAVTHIAVLSQQPAPNVDTFFRSLRSLAEKLPAGTLMDPDRLVELTRAYGLVSSSAAEMKRYAQALNSVGMVIDAIKQATASEDELDAALSKGTLKKIGIVL
jgi:hypothetical protein